MQKKSGMTKVVPDCKNLHLRSEKVVYWVDKLLASLGLLGGQIKGPLKLRKTIELCCLRGLKGRFKWASMMPRDASLKSNL